MKMLSIVKKKVLTASIALDSIRAAMSSRVVKGVVGLPLLLAGKQAAAADTILEMIDVSTTGLSSTQTGIVKAARTVGVVLCACGLWKWKEKNKEGSRVEGKTVFSFLLVGACLIALAQFISITGKSVGIEANVDG